MKYGLLLLLFVGVACKSDKKYHSEDSYTVTESKKMQDILDFQEKTNASFKDPETSPLPDRFRKDFKGLDFFDPDTTYMVLAKLERTPEAIPFLMSTTTDEKRNEAVYAVAHFELNGAKRKLEIYQSREMPEEGFEDYLFLPFLDETNGETTYGGGRYIDLRIPEGDSILIDFNKAYNPYCVYNKKYSCPLVPRQNYLRTNVRAGVKDFAKE
ncbi:DUF1684 domain-containing protein [Flagellimonas flava]|uniref:DUF1684 domain-containing protein n=1 Tax=Flagellimonas flava TaxID=570519 RepID=A0A1M5HLY0_9FLAO|nr:DUF1684 domain-containing protein [Allomuricauda flava]SHG16964.1 hypothetical protein SAMN04488116_0062 [Allomuricauda flava]